MSQERRLILLLADGTGSFDSVRVFMIEDMVILDGHVGDAASSQKADVLARQVGFASVMNLLTIRPQNSPNDAVNHTRLGLTKAFARQGWTEEALIQLKKDTDGTGVDQFGSDVAPKLAEISARLQMIIDGLRAKSAATTPD